MGYPQHVDRDPNPGAETGGEFSLGSLPLQSRTFAFGGSRTILLTTPGEGPPARGSAMVLLSATLLRTLLAAARSLGPPRPPPSPRPRLDIRV